MGKGHNGYFVLENRAGQVVRTLNWEAEEASVIVRADTGRIEAHSNLKELEEKEIPFVLLANIKKNDLEKKPATFGKLGSIRFVPEILALSPLVIAKEDDPKIFALSLKWISGAGSAAMFMILVLAHFLAPKPLETTAVVTLVERPIEKVEPEPLPKEKVRPQKKIVVAASKSIKTRVPHVARMKTLRVSNSPKKEVALNQLGALGVFGQLSKSKQVGGINLDNVKTSPGIGRGGSQGSGGMQTSIYGTGLVSAPLGSGNQANGGGGYGTKGKGGGQAGYGRMSLVGSSGAYFQPVDTDALVEGGLDRNAIAAVIQRHQGEIRYCYEQGLQQKPNLSGRVSIRFFIGGDGVVTSSVVSNSSLHSSQVESCISGHLKGWRFPAPRGGVTVKVTYPFVLRRVSES